ncbi:MAG: hypothetical protein ACXU91_03465 [Gemmatimonadaceae bacterium]
MPMLLGILAPLMTAALGCHHTAPKPSVAIEADSLTGIVSITGTSFEQQIVLRSGATATLLSAAAPDSAALSRLGGVEVLVVGRKAGNHFRVEHFTALSVAGSPVVDGIVRNYGDRVVVETARGPLPLGNPPTGLRALNGARVWIGGALATGPNTYGVIVPAQ